MRTELTLDERYDLINLKHITLDGKPACIAGAKCEFPVVMTLDGKQRVEFSWWAVVNVVRDRGGKFQS